MNKVLIFTNKSSWIGISDEIRDRVEWKSYPNMTNPIMECVSGVYLVYDSIGINKLKDIFEACADDFFYILIHTKGHGKEVFAPWRQFCYILKGKHENDNEDLYLPTFDILTDENDNKLRRIINSIFLNNALIELLNECYAPNNNLDNSNAYRALRQDEEIRDDLESFKRKYETSKKLVDYLEDLRGLQYKIEEIFQISNSNS